MCVCVTPQCASAKGQKVYMSGSAWVNLPVGGWFQNIKSTRGTAQSYQSKHTQRAGLGPPCDLPAPAPSRVSGDGWGKERGFQTFLILWLLALGTTLRTSAAWSCVCAGVRTKGPPPSTLNLGPCWADGPRGTCTTVCKRLSVWGQEALGTALVWKRLQKRGPPPASK